MRKEVVSIQVLRGIAATLVVVAHAARHVTVNWPDTPRPMVFLLKSDAIANFGGIGVDIFFVISGFIMFYVSEPYLKRLAPARDFMIRRIIRIYPMYALATIATIVQVAIHYARHREAGFPFDLGAERIAAAFAMIPTYDAAGVVHPVLGVGWTLFYEMFFYFCFFGVLCFSRSSIVTPLAVLLLSAIGIGWLTPPSALAAFLSNPIMIEFIFGCMVGYLYTSNRIPRVEPAMLLVLFVALIAIPFAVNLPDQFEFIFWGVPSAVLVVLFLRLEGLRWPRLARVVGDASYSIYLVHLLVLSELMAKAHGLIASNRVYADVYVVAFSVVAVATGIAVYRYIERPITRALVTAYRRWQSEPAQRVIVTCPHCSASWSAVKPSGRCPVCDELVSAR